MHYKKKKTGAGKIVLLVLIILLLLAGAAFAVFYFLFGGKDKIDDIFAEPPVPFFAEGQASALSLAPPEGVADEAGLRAYFGQAVAFAKENGFNTLVFEGKTDLTVHWKDPSFPLPEAFTPAADSGSGAAAASADPLAILCEVLEGQEIQLWLSMDPYASGGYTTTMQSPAAELATRRNGAYHQAFGADDKEFASLLENSLKKLPLHYPVATVVLRGLAPAGDGDGSAQQAEAFTGLLQTVRAHWESKEYPTRLALDFDVETSFIGYETARRLYEDGTADYLLPRLPPGVGLAGQVGQWAATGGMVAVQPENDAAGVLMFCMSQADAPLGVLLGGYAELAADTGRIGLLRSAMRPAEGALPAGFDIPQYLGITYPVEGKSLTWDSVYMTGTSNPDAPLYVNGMEITDRAFNGAFAVFVPLEIGDNVFEFSNGDVTATKTITRIEPATSPPATPKADGTTAVQPGQAIRIQAQIASALTNYADYGSINETFTVGGVAVVRECVQFQESSTTKTYAYKLTSGDWVLAQNCVKIQGDGRSAFTGLTAQSAEGGEWIDFIGTGTPASYVAYGNDDGKLTITMYDTSFSLPEGFTSEFCTGAWVETISGGVVLTLQTQNIWGYSLEYVDDATTRLFLKAAPVPSQNPERPLEGIHVLLDPGHGPSMPGVTSGAPGLAGDQGYPNEKDLNLALAQVMAYRLRQLGAEVSFTRSDDESNPTLAERLAMQTELKPHFFLSIHHDGLDGNVDLSGSGGLLGYYFHPYNAPNSKLFAQNVMYENVAATGLHDKGARWGYYYVTRNTVCASMLFEYGLLVHPQDFANATSMEGMYTAACATAAAMVNTLHGQAPPAAE